MSMKTILFTIIALCSVLTINGRAQGKEQAAVESAVSQLRLLMIDPDQSKLASLASDELSYGHSNGKIEDKKAFIEALTSGSSDFKTIDLSEQTVSVVDNVAMVRHKLMAETANDGKPGTAKLAVLLVWVKQKGSWKLLARQAVKI